MTRERSLVLAVAVAMVVLLGALLQRAIATVQREEALRREMIADRVFDELERELAAMLDREEARPFLHYSYAFVPDNEAGTAGIKSISLAVLPESGEVVGYFQLAPDGTLSTPHRPATGTSINPIAQVEAIEVRLARATAGLTEASVAVAERPEVPVQQSRAPLSALNRGLTTPNKRPAQKQSLDVFQAGAFMNNSGPEQLVEVQQKLATPPERARRQHVIGLPRLPVAQGPDGRIEVVVEPFVTRENDEELVLYRTVQLGPDRWLQGLVLDRDALVSRLERTVRVGELADLATLDWTGAGTFGHRFRSPFDSLEVGLSLEGLPARQSTTWFWGLAAVLLGVVGLAGAIGSRWLAETRALARQRADFVAAVSHELRSPLTSIRMYSEMLEQGMAPDPERQQGYFRTIRLEAERLGRLVEDVLAFSRIERGSEREGQPGRLGDVVDEVGRVFQPIAERDGFTFTVEVDPVAREATVSDRDAMAQVLTNLVDNAMKFSREREVRVVELVATPHPSGVAVAVRDRGPGVEPRLLPRIFDAFTRGGSELTRRTKGTGIGLALVAGLVAELAGQVKARNTPDGFEVVVHLPVQGATSAS